ncbi:hypothetical protein RMSM_03320 [Rhodopirellula maiorica SM1]|uniref:Uncharacterized protein n=1 Tax=Rhodopirellula maiorica SM1 TaxID=1265738 RepID=M5RKP2_9BACT|nr:hypothetical protein [Rhodopirellula maiorica]EMI19761.1 hypothetical protein RMSM_03320 [Rhodopirellula maiorica SM1]
MSTRTTEAENASPAPAPSNGRPASPKKTKAKKSSRQAAANGTATADEPATASANDHVAAPPKSDENWKLLRKKIESHSHKSPAKDVFGKSAIGGTVYRWGVATASGSPIDPVRMSLSQLACDQKPIRRRSTRPLDLVSATTEMIAQLDHGDMSALSCHDAVIWAGAMPQLIQQLEPVLWWELLGSLQRFRELVLQSHSPDSHAHLIVGAELGLTLAWRLAELPSCKRAQKSAIESFAQWCDHEEDAIPNALADATTARLILGSIMRCQALLKTTAKKKFQKSWHAVGDEMATWVAALTTHRGTSAFSRLGRGDVKDDLGKTGLLEHAIAFDPETLRPATEAALGLGHTGGRLAWEVCLPESFVHSDGAKLAVMLPEWDVRRGRTHLHYAGEHNQLEIFAGRTQIVAGQVQTSIEINGAEQAASGDWELICEYTDDEVHYIEIEQDWTGGVVLQRQLMLIRSDRSLMLADGVLPKNRQASESLSQKIRYSTRIPFASGVSPELEKETREVYLCAGQHAAVVIPLSASEWRIGPTTTKLSASEDEHLVWSAEGTGAMYVPLWFDLQRRRFKRKRTWRQLTVADERRICEQHEAAGFRVQVGSEQWLVYRSLGDRRCRTVLGKHLIADFFAAKFDQGEGIYDELVTVDDAEDGDEPAAS